jgi:DNA polymerase elongation subunit (family B)
VQKTLSSAAYGDNNYFYISAPGVLHLDVMQLIKREHKFESYSLNFVSKQILGDSKIDLKPAEIFAKFKGSNADRAIIAEYCAKDVLLPLKLVLGKLAIFQNCVEMANATSVPVEYLITRGQTIKVFSLILQKARALGFVCPDIDRPSSDAPNEKYEGATVLNAETGAYLSDIVSALDFASLYPSIIRAHRMCPSTLVRDPRYDNLPGVEYYTVDTPKGTYKFAQVETAVLPALLDDLALFRKAAKKRMAEAKAAGDTFAESVENGKQLAYKVCMNSAYGFFGAAKGFLPCVEIAASVTTTGRNMIAKTKALAESLVPGSRVIYGDSVAGYTPIFIRHPTGAVELTTFHRLSDLFRMPFLRSPCGKQYLPIPPGVHIWSDAGWTPFIRAIRHRISKKLVRVVTRTGIVDCTEDHSLLKSDGDPVRPAEVRVGETLMHVDLPPCRSVGKFEGRAGDWQIQAAARFVAMERPVIRAQEWGEWILAEANSSEELHHPDEVLDVCQLTDLDILSAPFEPFVYDATTANHHFAAGIGRLVVHNTDSVMCIFNCGEENRTNMHKHFEVAQYVADTITKEFKAPNELEFEKTYHPYLLFSKKRYAGMLYTEPHAPAYRDAKGLQLVRRDNCQLVKDVSNDILETIMRDKSASLAVAAAKKHILALLQNKNPMESYITSKSLKSDYKNPDSQPHYQVALKIHQRRGYPVSSGERVPYIFIEDSEKPDGLQAQRAEDPTFAQEHGLVVDRLHYLDSQISGPVETLLDVLEPGTYASLINSPEIKPLLDELRAAKTATVAVAKRVRKNSQNKQHEITSFFSRC